MTTVSIKTRKNIGKGPTWKCCRNGLMLLIVLIVLQVALLIGIGFFAPPSTSSIESNVEIQLSSPQQFLTGQMMMATSKFSSRLLNNF
jgi:hypothetical protein